AADRREQQAPVRRLLPSPESGLTGIARRIRREKARSRGVFPDQLRRPAAAASRAASGRVLQKIEIDTKRIANRNGRRCLESPNPERDLSPLLPPSAATIAAPPRVSDREEVESPEEFFPLRRGIVLT
ncbi:hypothetical protein HAX54_012645, partial [Datura stramonium]|nr:hypothetical protein [Datura stramonium]